MFCQSVSRMVMDVVNPAHINAEREDGGGRGGGWRGGGGVTGV